MERHEQHDLAQLIRNNRLRDELIPIKRLPDLLPSSRPGKRIALATIYRWILRGKLRSRKIGGSVYVTVDDLIDFIGSRSQQGARPTGHPASEMSAAADRAGEELDRLLSNSVAKDKPLFKPDRRRAKAA